MLERRQAIRRAPVNSRSDETPVTDSTLGCNELTIDTFH